MLQNLGELERPSRQANYSLNSPYSTLPMTLISHNSRLSRHGKNATPSSNPVPIVAMLDGPLPVSTLVGETELNICSLWPLQINTKRSNVSSYLMLGSGVGTCPRSLAFVSYEHIKSRYED